MHFVWIFLAFLQFPRRQRHSPPPSPSPSFRPGQPTPLQTRSPSLGPLKGPYFKLGNVGLRLMFWVYLDWSWSVANPKKITIFQGSWKKQTQTMHDNFWEIPEKHPIDSIKCDSPPPQQNGSQGHTPRSLASSSPEKNYPLDIKSTQTTQLLVFKTSVSRGVMTSGSS